MPGRGPGHKMKVEMQDIPGVDALLEILNQITVAPHKGNGTENLPFLGGLHDLFHIGRAQAQGLFHGKGNAAAN